MVKGVNRQVLEVHETGCDYFEKALFFIKPEYSAQSDSRLKGGALKAIQNSAAVPKTRRQKIKGRLFFVFELAASAGVGSIITAIFLK